MRWNNICVVENNTAQRKQGFPLAVYTWGDFSPHMAGTSGRGQIVNGETCTTAKVIPTQK